MNWRATRTWVTLLLVILLTALALTPRAGADGENRVALVVATGDGTAVTRCVSFEEEEISGYEVLNRSGLGVEVDLQAGSAAVCRIGQTGCPAADCFCQCRGGDDCVYWSYWHLMNGAWQYGVAGASLYKAQNGDVEGWSWGPGSVTSAVPPPVFTFDEICSASTTPTQTPTVTLSPSPSPTPLVLLTPTAPIQDGGGAQPTATGTIAPTPSTPAQPAVSTIAPTIESPPTAAILTPFAMATQVTPEAAETGASTFLSEPEPTEVGPPAETPSTPEADTVALSRPLSPERTVESSPPTLTIADETPTAEPIEAAATRMVIGQGQAIASAEIDAAAAPAEGSGAPGAADGAGQVPISYVAFAGLLTALAGFFFVARARRRGRGGAE